MNRRDKAIADEVADDTKAEKALMCRAAGCPLRWSVASEGRQQLCSVHAWADSNDWPRLTGWLQERHDRALMGTATTKPATPPVSRADVFARYQRFAFAAPSRNWAEKLRQREQAGQRLTDAQKAMWRAALGVAVTSETCAGDPL